MKDFYEILGVSSDASAEEIKSAYHRLAKKFHPDHNSGDKDFEEQFKLINEAYQTLYDSQKRNAYDSQLNASKRSNRNRKQGAEKGSPASFVDSVFKFAKSPAGKALFTMVLCVGTLYLFGRGARS